MASAALSKTAIIRIIAQKLTLQASWGWGLVLFAKLTTEPLHAKSETMNTKPIVLIGPMATGKSTVATHLAKITGRPNVPMDRVRGYYYITDGMNLEHEASLNDFAQVMAYWKPFEVKAVRRIIKEFPHAVIDFGAGHSVYTDPNQLKEVADLLAPIPHVYLLLPSEDREKSISICNERLSAKRKGRPIEKDEIDANRLFVMHESNYTLAKKIVFSEGKTAMQVAQEIAALI